ncbi:hypothetical protein [Methanoregula boonei]|jgi:hypothetical protein|uniref:hypothetical protein n=1 Tax=Methanoregula boonei TaxID=358766 RepID=UPI00064EC9F1|nr:hypothetical protein [Methanoregula boonei]
MKLIKIGTGICALCIIAFILIAGCTSQSGGSDQGQTTTASAANPQVTTTPTAASTPGSAGSDNSAFIYDSGSAPGSGDQSQVTLASDTPIDTSTGAAAQNLSSDSTDLGDITP